MQTNQTLSSQAKPFLLSAVSSLGVVKHHRAQNHYGIFLCWLSTSVCWRFEKQRRRSTGRSEQQLAALNKRQICETNFLSKKEIVNLSANTELAKI